MESGHFPIIVNIWMLASATRFNGTRITTLMLMANLFLLVWHYDRLKYILPFGQSTGLQPVPDKNSRFPLWFFGLVLAVAASVIAFDDSLYPVRPGNEPAECTNGCRDKANPGACLGFCDCIDDKGNPLQNCLDEYQKAKGVGAEPNRQRNPR